MPEPLYDPDQLSRLRKAIDYSYENLAPYREKRKSLIEDYVGRHYGRGDSKKRTIANFIELASHIYLMHLAADQPKALIATPYEEFYPVAANLELALGKLMSSIRIKDTLQEAVINSLFSSGIIKVGLSHAEPWEIQDMYFSGGQPFAETVSLDDWVHDVTAKRYSLCKYCGDKYKLPLEVVKQSALYENTDDLTSSEKTNYNATGEEKAAFVGEETVLENDEYIDEIELWDIWLPHEGKIITFPIAEETPVIRVVDWEGPPHGPYHILGLGRVPDHIMPLAPSYLWKDLHDLANRLLRKLASQAERQKSLTFYQRGAENDADTVNKAKDGDTVGLDNPAGVKDVSFGGPDSVNLAFFLQSKDIFSWINGNLDALGGLSPQSDTIGQDAMLTSTASKRMGDMQNQVIDYTRGICRDLAWYLWEDPLIQIPLTKRVEGTDLEIPVTFSQEEKEGNFLDYNFEVEPYSLQYRPPMQRVQMILSILERAVYPALPMLEAQGYIVNFEALYKMISRYTNLPELNQILSLLREPQVPQAGPVVSPQISHRTYERVNRSAGTRQGNDATMARALIGGNPQASEMAALTKGSGG